jgi:hypothetical protein
MPHANSPSYRLNVSGHLFIFDFGDLAYASLVGQTTVFGDDVCFLWYRRDSVAFPFERVPYDDPRFVDAAGYWLLDLLLPRKELPCVYALIGDRFVRVTQQSLLSADRTRRVEPIWCPVANVAEQIQFGAQETLRRGTKHFAAGAKVYCRLIYGGGESVEVVGHHRRSHRYITIVIQAKYLTRWRSELVYSPHVICEMAYGWDGTPASKERAEGYVTFLAERERMHAATKMTPEQRLSDYGEESLKP